MRTIDQHKRLPLQRANRVGYARFAPKLAAALLKLVLVFALVLPGSLASAASPQAAIENLERCSPQERKQGCVNILRQERMDNTNMRIKAEVRGGRIIWYQYNTKNGSVRRLN